MNPEGAKKAGKELIPKITQIEVSTVACFPFHSLSPSASLPRLESPRSNGLLFEIRITGYLVVKFVKVRACLTVVRMIGELRRAQLEHLHEFMRCKARMI